MNSHSKVCGPSPSHLFRLFLNNIENYGDLNGESNWETLLEDVVLNFRNKLGFWNCSVSEEELYSISNRNIFELLKYIYEKEAVNKKASHIFIKENESYQFAGDILEYIQDSRFVYLVRDPRDVASSWISTDTIPGGVEKAVEIWMRDQKKSVPLFEKLLLDNKIILVRYEDLITKPEETLKKIVGLIGLHFESNMLEFYNNDKTVDNSNKIDAWNNLKKPLISTNSNKYRTVLSKEDIRYIELNCYPYMEYFGYSAETELNEKHLDKNVQKEIEILRPKISRGKYSIESDKELKIRESRLASIKKVLSRELR